jgi:hypothetical protein
MHDFHRDAASGGEFTQKELKVRDRLIGFFKIDMYVVCLPRFCQILFRLYADQPLIAFLY